MTDTPPDTSTDAETKATKSLTKTQVAKLVACKPDDILDFKDYGTHVIAVTIDGQKHRGDKNAKA